MLAQPLGAGRANILSARMIDLADRVDAVLPIRIPDSVDPPFAILAVVRSTGRPAHGRQTEGLEGASLELVPGDAATA